VGLPLPGKGELGLLDRPCTPARSLRRLRFTGPRIAEMLAMPLSTISGILTRIGMGGLGRLGLQPAERYERARPCELIHVHVEKLGTITRLGHRFLGDAGSPIVHRFR
jgi:hypothetical protein